MIFIPFCQVLGPELALTEDGVGSFTLGHGMEPFHFQVDPLLVGEARMVMCNQLLELLINGLLGKEIGHDTNAKAQRIIHEYVTQLVKNKGITF